MWVRAGMCERGCVFNAEFAVFCAVFRRGEQGCASRDVLAGMCWQGCADRDVASGYSFFFKIVGLRKNKGVSLW